MAYREFPQHFPQPGWVEHDALDILNAVTTTLAGGRARVEQAGDTVVAIGITNQRETIVAWDRTTGMPRHRAIVWQDRRTAPDCERLQGRRPRAVCPCAHRPRARPLLLRDEVEVAADEPAKAEWRPTPTSRSAPSTRGSAGTSPARNTAACTRPSRRTRAARSCSTSARTSGRANSPNSSAFRSRVSPTCIRARAASGSRRPRTPRVSPFPSAASPGISRRPCSGKAASPPA